MTAPRKRLTREDWLDLSLTELSAHGPDALRLDAICAAAGLTKGAFYHHFKDHSVFLDAVMEHWYQRQTEGVIGGVDPAAFSDDMFEALVEAAMKADFHLEMGIRHLVQHHPRLRSSLERADTRRMDFAVAIYAARFDLSEAEARDLAFMDYAAYAGFSLLKPDISAEERLRLTRLYDRMLRTTFQKRSGT